MTSSAIRTKYGTWRSHRTTAQIFASTRAFARANGSYGRICEKNSAGSSESPSPSGSATRPKGVFQQTTNEDPLVWHHDTQGYAAAVYLTPDAPPESGTSFWRDTSYGCRRRPNRPLEAARLQNPNSIKAAEAVVYDAHNVVNADNWELVESIAGLYNRLVIWDAALIHSATSYSNFSEEGPVPTRLVQLFFFDAD